MSQFRFMSYSMQSDNSDSGSASNAGASDDSSSSVCSYSGSESESQQEESASFTGKLAKVDPICPFQVTADGFIFCTYCNSGVVSASKTKDHINRHHQSSKVWLKEMKQHEAVGAMTMDELIELYSEKKIEPRQPFSCFPILPGYQCKACGDTSKSRSVILKHSKLCLNFAIANVKCQQPLRWADPRDRKLNFQRVFAVVDSPTDVKDFPETTFAASQTLDSTSSNVNPASLGMLLNWSHLHKQKFKSTPDTVFNDLTSLAGTEIWMKHIKSLSDAYFRKIHETILSVESQGSHRDLCRLKMHSKHGIVPARGFYWLSENTVAKYSNVLCRLMAFISRICSVYSASVSHIPLVHPELNCVFSDIINELGSIMKFTDILHVGSVEETFDVQHFHAALFSIVSQPVSDSVSSDLEYPLMAFVRFASHRAVQQQQPKFITPLISALKYIVRGCVLVEAKTLFSQNPDIKTDRLDTCKLLDVAQRDSATMFDKLCGVNNICFSVIIAESEVALSSDFKTVTIRCQKQATLGSLQAMVVNLFEQTRRSINDLLPYDAALTDYKVGHHPENTTNTLPGFSIFNGVIDETALKEYILHRRIHESGSNMRLFLKQAEMFQKFFAMLIMLVPGSPTRGAEQSAWLLVNTADSKRNVFYDTSKQLVYISWTRTKTSRQRQKDKVHMKYLNEEMSLFAFNYFGIVRPMERFFAHNLSMSSISLEAFKSSMFVFDGRPATSSDFSDLCRSFCLNNGLPAMGLRDLRQCLIAFSRAWLAEFSRQATVFDFIERHVASQAAHSINTHRNRYGGNRPLEEETGFFIASCANMWLMGAQVPLVGVKHLPAIAQTSKSAGQVLKIAPKQQVSGPNATELYERCIEDYFIFARNLLHEFKMHKNVDFRSHLQAEAVVRSLKRMEFLYIAPCGLGKSLIFWLPLLSEKQTTVLFLPYVLLRRNVHFYAETLGIESVLLELAKSINIAKPPKLLVCAVEQLSLIPPILMQLARRNMLARIVIDELQCIFTEEFRSVMKDYRTWRAQLAFGEILNLAA